VSAHRLSRAVLTRIARGGGGPVAVRQLAAVRRSRTLLLIRGVHDMAEAAGHPEAASVREAYQALAQVHRLVPHAVERLLSSPLVGAWAMSTATLLADGRTGQARPGRLAEVAAAAALHGAVPMTIVLPPTGGGTRSVVLPSVGTATFPGSGPVEVTFRTDGTTAKLVAGTATVRIPPDLRTDAPGWRGVRRISAWCEGLGLKVSVEELGWSQLPDVPDLRDGVPDDELGSVWRTRMEAGWQLLVRHHRRIAAEAAAALKVITPLASPAVGGRSVTFRDAFGCLAMSAPACPRWVAVTLAHEVQHAKLTVVMDVVRLTEPGGERFYAPWRDDPRPLDGLLHGAYAHLGVVAFWRRQRLHETDAGSRFRAHVEFVRWLEACTEVSAVLRTSGRLTPPGYRFVADMQRVLCRWSSDKVPDDAVALARQLAGDHRRRWREAHRDGGSAGPPVEAMTR
jgi:HEXXH motif-containing protein